MREETSSKRLYRYDRPMRDIVSEKIRQEIFTRGFPPGTRLVEADLAEKYGVSRLPIREALRILQKEGLIEPLPSRGMIVVEHSRREVMELYEIREILESLAVRRATERAKPEQIAELWEQLKAAREALRVGDIDEVNRRNATFHDLVVEAGDSNVLDRVLESVVMQLHWLYSQVSDFWELADEHEDLLRAIESGDVDLAERRSRAHVQHYRDLTLGLLFSVEGGAD